MHGDRRAFALTDSEAMLRQLLLELDDLRLSADQRYGTTPADSVEKTWPVSHAANRQVR